MTIRKMENSRENNPHEWPDKREYLTGDRSMIALLQRLADRFLWECREDPKGILGLCYSITQCNIDKENQAILKEYIITKAPWDLKLRHWWKNRFVKKSKRDAFGTVFFYKMGAIKPRKTLLRYYIITELRLIYRATCRR